MFGNKLCRFGSLSRISKAHTEFIASGCDAVQCSCGWCEKESTLSSFSTYSNTGTGSYGSAKHLHSLVKKVIICINCFLRISLVIACIQNLYLITVESTVCIDLIYCNLGSIIYVCTILCIITCHRSDYTDFKCLVLCKYRYRSHCCHDHCCSCSKAYCFFPVFHNNSSLIISVRGLPDIFTLFTNGI